MIEELAALAEDAAEGFRHRKRTQAKRESPPEVAGVTAGNGKLPVRHVEAENAGDPVAGLPHLPLMTARAKMLCLAREGEEALVAAVAALQTGKARSEVAAAVELANDVNDVASQRAVNGAVAFLVTGFEVGPAVVDELTPSMQSGFARFSCC
jgi:hypothetical protein